MCGRYTLYDTLKSKLYSHIDIEPNYNVCPSSKVLIINNKMEIEYGLWSMKSSWSDQINIINARSESLDTKNMFKNTERCILIANGYFEWKKMSSGKIPYYHTYSNNMMYFGGVKNTSGICIVTRNSYKNISYIHHRQPVILGYEDFEKWFQKKHDYSSEVSKNIITYKVSNTVNKPINNSIKNIEKVL